MLCEVADAKCYARWLAAKAILCEVADDKGVLCEWLAAKAVSCEVDDAKAVICKVACCQSDSMRSGRCQSGAM